MPSRRALLLAFVLTLAPGAALRAQSGVVEVNGVVLPYEVQGSGPPLVLIHGWAVNRAFWDLDVERLARQHTAIRYDRRGFGAATGKPDATADAADLKALLERLGYAKVHVMGHSAGARKVVIPGGGHVVNWAQPERFAAEVLGFLR